jgi:hypothetical protein
MYQMNIDILANNAMHIPSVQVQAKTVRGLNTPHQPKAVLRIRLCIDW